MDERSREAALDALLDYTPLMAQQPAPGFYAQVQGLFDRGSLIAVHTSAQRANGIGGSAAARISVSHTAPREHIGVLGAELNWHGGLTLDYLHQNGTPQYIECNPRTVEPGNATASGVNIAELQVRLTLGEQLGPVHAGRQAYAPTGRSRCCWAPQREGSRADPCWAGSLTRSPTGAPTRTAVSS